MKKEKNINHGWARMNTDKKKRRKRLAIIANEKKDIKKETEKGKPKDGKKAEFSLRIFLIYFTLIRDYPRQFAGILLSYPCLSVQSVVIFFFLFPLFPPVQNVSETP